MFGPTLISSGLVSATGIGKGQKALGPYVEGLVRKLISLFSNTVEDAAKTQVYLAASKDVREKDIHGEYWQAIWTWTRAYSGVTSEEQTALGKDEEEQKKLWDVSEAAMKEAAPSALK